MHLFNINRLAAKLRANTLSEAEKYRYFLVMVVLRIWSDAGRLAISQPKNHFAGLVSMAIISILGFHICYKVNQRGDNQRFIERLICLSVPISIWAYLANFLFYYGGFVVAQTLLGRAEALSIWAMFSSAGVWISGAFLVVYFGALIYFIGQIARAQAATPTAPLAAP